ncbi:MAG: 3-hydroxybutyryl-CoA dehydrogenase [Chloroflexota bacterium]|nr:3-hydroxybutyryl-CoA dehydrogenase [Chloroflexota bacterium]MDE3192422.1 3-hydroxybutyryl-CoA dehydrogenase [Chloroflexota bacterium]
MAIERVGVVGFGAMGSGIAQVCASAGCSVTVREVDQAAIDRGWKGIDSSLARVVKAGRMAEDEAKAARARIGAATTFDAFADRDLVIEAVLEIADVKRKVFEELDRLCPPSTIFASNTSSLPIVDMAVTTKRPQRFAGLHFFNPAPVMPLVEVVQAVTTSDETVATLKAFVQRIGKVPVVSKDVAGFIVNRLLVPYMLDAIRVLEQGIASVEDIDTAVKNGLRHPMGPFELLDYTGLDIAYHVANVFFEEFKEPRMAPPPLLKRMVAAGRLGKKTGRGFYEWDDKGIKK